MQITVNIPDELAAELAAKVQSRGLALETYVEQLVVDQARQIAPGPPKKKIDLDTFFAEMAKGMEDVPVPPDFAFTRESIYSDHD
jgi:hypothetical protein